MVLYRHFVRTHDGAICELEESLPFTVDSYPLLERWPQRRRKVYGTEDSRMVEPQDILGNPQGGMSPRESNSPDPILRTAKGDLSFDKSEASFLEPQVILVKGD